MRSSRFASRSVRWCGALITGAALAACSDASGVPEPNSPAAGAAGTPGMAAGGSPGASGSPAEASSGAASSGAAGESAGASNGGSPGAGAAGAPGAGGTAGMGTAGAATAGAATAGGGGSSGVSSSACDPTAPALDAALRARCSGSSPLTCTFGGSAGHYDVTMLLGGPARGSTVVTAESRRHMLGQTTTMARESRCVSFTVNVRSPEGQPIQDVPAGTAGLNFRLEGSAPQLQGIGVRAAQNPTVVYIAGDSTVCDQDPQLDVQPNVRFTGWGQMIPQYFAFGVSVTNYADSGESTQAFRTDGGSLWAPIARGMKAGDYVLIQLGHNDKTTPGATYRSRITSMVRAVKAASAVPVLISPIARNSGGTLAQQHIYGDLNVRTELAAIAAAENVAYIDFTAITYNWMTMVGRTVAQTYFVRTDATHTNELGGQLFAEFLVQAFRDKQLPIASRLR